MITKEDIDGMRDEGFPDGGSAITVDGPWVDYSWINQYASVSGALDQMYDYYDPNYEEGFLGQMTPMDMVKEYHKVAELPIGVRMEKARPELLKLRWDLVEEEFNEFAESLETGSARDGVQEGDIKELADLVYVLYGWAVTFGVDLDEALRRVHKNNMERMYQDDGTIKRREDGKILKNPNTPKVDLSDLV